MTKTGRLDALFDEWVEDFPKYKGKFKKDGIVNENMYTQQDTKLLFIAKEPNDPKQEDGDFREWWSKEVKHSFSHRICEWAYGLLNDFPLISNLSYDNKNRTEVMSKIAFMNIKKSGGGATANQGAIKETLNEELYFIQEEISIISPDIIIGGINNENYWNYIFPEIEFKESGYERKVAKVNGYKIIDFYHPSYRVPRAMSYYLLSMVINSEVFKDL